MKLLEKIKKELISALKARDKLKAGVLKVLLAEIKNKEISKRPLCLEESDIKDVIAKEIKDREEGIRIYKGANILDRVERLEKEISILRVFLPLLSELEISNLIEEGIAALHASSESDMGKVLGFVMKRARGQIDSDIVKELILNKVKDLH